MSLALRNITLPPSSRIPTSKETRVRVEDFVKISAQDCPASGLCWLSPRSFLNTAAFCRMTSISPRDSDSKLNRCFILGSEFSDDRLDDLDAFLSLAPREIERRQNADHRVPSGNAKCARFVQPIHKLNRRRAITPREPRNVRHQLEADQQPKTPN